MAKTEIVDAWVIGGHVIPPEVIDEALNANADMGVAGQVLVRHRESDEFEAYFETLTGEEFDGEYEWTTEGTE